MSVDMSKHGAFGWVELMTRDVDSAKRFYKPLFGWETEDNVMGTDYTVIKVGGEPVGGIMNMPPECPVGMPPVWSVYVTVDDVDAIAARVPSLGGKVIRPPMTIPGPDIRFCVIEDPQGATICAITYPKR